MPRRWLAVAALLAALARPSAAQTATDASRLASGVAARTARWQPHAGLYVGTPQRFSVALGLMRVAWRAADFTAAGGPRLVLEPGLAAGKVRLGYAHSGAFATGYSVEAAVLRRWRDAPRQDASAMGLEVHGSLMFIDLGLGLYKPRSSGAGLVAASIGLIL